VSKWDYSVALDIGGSHMNAESKGTRKQSTFGYSLSPDEEVGFYVVCSDRMILDSINSLMKNRGYIGISDTAGRLHYMVDARSGIRAAVNQLRRKRTGSSNILLFPTHAYSRPWKRS
jgi:hypothetical protein